MFDRKLHRTDMLRCTLCQNAPCSSVCKKIDCASMLRSIWFDNEKTAASSPPSRDFINAHADKEVFMYLILFLLL